MIRVPPSRVSLLTVANSRTTTSFAAPVSTRHTRRFARNENVTKVTSQSHSSKTVTSNPSLQPRLTSRSPSTSQFTRSSSSTFAPFFPPPRSKPQPPPSSSSHPPPLLTVAIETSCDDTCVAILTKPPQDTNQKTDHSRARLLFNEKITAPDGGHGGIHPLEALASHGRVAAGLVERALGVLPDFVHDGGDKGETATRGKEMGDFLVLRDGSMKRKPDFISVTRGPGMRSNLHCGINLAKGLSVAWQVPLLGVHHMQAHALTPRLVSALEPDGNDDGGSPSPDFPFLTLLVSGGHTMLLSSTGLVDHKILATTSDVAIGDALDKCGRLLLPDDIKAKIKDTSYARHLSAYAFPKPNDFAVWPIATARMHEIDKPNNDFGWQLQTPLADSRDLRFSFSGLSSQVERIFQSRDGKNWSSDERLLMARTVLGTAFEHLGSRVVIALEDLKKKGIKVPTLVVSGGVAANDFLRYLLRAMLDIRGFRRVKLAFPPVALCTDNAAMIAWTGMEMFEAGYRSDYEIDAVRKWSMDAQDDDGGILGVGGWTRTTA